jgi:aminoglycoside 2'-N-acetyltransferase I
VASLTRAHTAELDAHALAEVRDFLEEAFAGELSGEDWDHTIGGVHVLAREDGALVGHASVVQRRLVVEGVGLRTGYVEAVAVRRAWDRKRGHGRG